MYLRSPFFVRGNLSVCKYFWIFWLWGATPDGEIFRPRSSTSLAPNWHLAIASRSPAARMHWKTSLKLFFNSSGVFVAIPMSSTYWAHLSAFMALYRYSLMKLEKDDSERLSPWASLRYANVLLAKLKARSWTDFWSAICSTWCKLVSSQVYKTTSCQRGVARHRLVC